jgi:hypothetical protein
MLTEVYKGIKDWKDLPRPNSVANATGDYLDGNNPVKAWLTANYDITNNDKDKIGASDLKRSFIEDTDTKGMADTKFKELMSFNNIKNKRTAIGQVYFGLKRKTNTEDVFQ